MERCRLFGSRRANLGMTYVESIVGLAIFALLITLAFETSIFTGRAVSEMVTASSLEVKGERTLKLVVESLTESANLGVDSDGSGLSYYVPTDLDGSGTVLQGRSGTIPGNLEYGVVTETTSGEGSMRFEFVPERIIFEVVEKVDFNGDGDLNDSFEMGYIQRVTSFSGDFPKTVGVSNVIQRAGKENWGKSILYDANLLSSENDSSGRIFDLETGRDVLKVSLYLLNISKDRTANLIQCRGQVFLRNQCN